MSTLVARATRPVPTATLWRHFPRIMIAVMLVVIAVNVRFIVVAVASFPGAASNDDFDTSNRYNAVLAAAARTRALGWTVRASTAAATPVLDLTTAGGGKLTGASVTAQAVRPLGNTPDHALKFQETAPGRYTADSALPLPGQWDLNLQIRDGADSAAATRRVVVPAPAK